MVKILAVFAGMLLAMPAPPLKDRLPSVYCSQAATGAWSVQKFKPLIRQGGGTVFAEMTFAASGLYEFRMRRFDADAETVYSYKFDGSGKLVGLMGSVLVKGPVIALPGDTEPPASTDWLAEADLMPGPDWKIPAHHVLYSRDKDRIDKPESADRFITRFDTAPVYQTVQAVPCASLLKEAKELNATQE
jgi:hypothetical protein